MQSVAIGHIALLHTLQWESVPSLKIYFDDLQVIEGNALAFTTPAIEAALVHCRALLEFMGISAKNEKTLEQRKSSRKDDVVIEHFTGPNGQLQKITAAEEQLHIKVVRLKQNKRLPTFFIQQTRGLLIPLRFFLNRLRRRNY